MSRNSQLFSLMVQDLPNRTSQRRMRYRTNNREVLALFKLINKEIFNSRLPTPEIQVQSNCRKYWGMCIAKHIALEADQTKSQCTIKLSDKWYCKQWLITTLAHEMCHQYQWDIESKKRARQGLPPIMSHGPSFYQFRDKLKKHGIPLKVHNDHEKWFVTQRLFKC